jgi:hypothetical protein
VIAMPRHFIKLIVPLLACGALLTGCVSDKPKAEPQTFGYERDMLPKSVAPAEMDALTGVLIRYRAEYGQLPAQLGDLAEAELMTAEQIAALPEYGYSARGLGVLADGSLIVLVDSRIRVPNQAWCIVQKPSKPGEPAVLETSMVPMAQLRASARAAK